MTNLILCHILNMSNLSLLPLSHSYVTTACLSLTDNQSRPGSKEKNDGLNLISKSHKPTQSQTPSGSRERLNKQRGFTQAY